MPFTDGSSGRFTRLQSFRNRVMAGTLLRVFPARLEGKRSGFVTTFAILCFSISRSVCFQQSHWTTKPQIRVLQTILLYLSYLDFTNEGPDTLIWIGSATRIAYVGAYVILKFECDAAAEAIHSKSFLDYTTRPSTTITPDHPTVAFREE